MHTKVDTLGSVDICSWIHLRQLTNMCAPRRRLKTFVPLRRTRQGPRHHDTKTTEQARAFSAHNHLLRKLFEAMHTVYFHKSRHVGKWALPTPNQQR